MRGLTKNSLLLCFLLVYGSFLNAQVLSFDSLAVKAGFEKPMILAKIDYENSVDNDLLSVGGLLAKFSFPADGKVISRYGVRSGRIHTGTDIKKHLGDTIYAAYYGKVICSQYRSGYGNLVVIQHEKNIETYYGHLSKYLVKVGESIDIGDPIGLAGATGRATTTHLHFEIRENDRPYNPELIYDFENRMIKPELENIEQLAELNVKEIKSKPELLHTKKYVVRRGDSLWTISHRVNTSVENLCMLNDLTESSILQPGQVLNVF